MPVVITEASSMSTACTISTRLDMCPAGVFSLDSMLYGGSVVIS